ncbi:hypothetical protein TRIATDRAFT_312727 [Trichoderma atroviride IMI 206040]|uniref:PAS domain-containing protein n=1 Tax=Hypocrea atroviridis (strain ATCC 20476 / IMI 206040) TaxID=452589 RepID=G9P5Z3_HYPAI|nr:uncharacterized protein TRIATDRAFT_312727 [Trichoderma atroviride IMI 206040]EHK42216.1 hypothetical protein TRIATDRAFT_312727 [Trichoderma atroviride IMI 206040]
MAGRLLYGEESLFKLYGLSIEELVARNLIISPRTTTGCMIDAHIKCLLRGVTDILGPDNESSGFDGALSRSSQPPDLDPGVYKSTKHNLALLGVSSQATSAGFSFTLSLTDYCNLLASRSLMNHPSDLYIIKLPWGSAASPERLDLTKTCPPVQEIMAEIKHQRAGVPCYFALQALRNIINNSLEVAMARATPVQVIQCSPVYGYGVDFHIYRLECNGRYPISDHAEPRIFFCFNLNYESSFGGGSHRDQYGVYFQVGWD